MVDRTEHQLGDPGRDVECTTGIADRLHRYRLERQGFRRAVQVVSYLETAVPDEFYDPVRPETLTALGVLEPILGARRLAQAAPGQRRCSPEVDPIVRIRSIHR